MQGADAGCTHLYGEPEASNQEKPNSSRLFFNDQMHQRNKGAVTYIHVAAALDVRSWISPSNTD